MAFLASIVARDVAPATTQILEFAVEKVRAPGMPLPNGADLRPLLARTNANTVALASGTKRDLTSTAPGMTTRPIAELASRGYFDSGAEEVVMYGPSTDALFDPSFTATHCLSLAPGNSAHLGQVGLAFQPTTNRAALPDIEGILWMDRSPSAVRSLEFSFVGAHAFANEQSGGRMRFRTAENGIVFIDEWLFFLPDPSRWDGLLGNPRTSRSIGAAPRLQLKGATILSTEWPDGTRISRPPPLIGGTVVESVTGAPLAGITVRIPGAGYDAPTAANGSFILAPPIAERYLVEAVDTSFLRFGVRRASNPVAADADSVRKSPITLSLRPMLTLARARCGNDLFGHGSTIVLARVVDSVGASSKAAIDFAWQDPKSKDPPKPRGSQGHGLLALCDVGAGTLTLTSSDSTGATGTAVLHPTGREGIDTVTITLRCKPLAVPATPLAGANIIERVGLVREGAGGCLRNERI